MKLNRKLVLVLALVLSVAMATGGTLAFLTDRDTVENTFTMGNVDIEVEEEYEQGSPLLPGVEVEKKAGVKNVHPTNEAWVWMTVSVPAELEDAIVPVWLEGYEGTKIDTPVHEGYVSYVVKHPYKLLPGTSTPDFLQGVTLTDVVDFQDGKYVVVENGVIVGELASVDDLKVIVDGFAMQPDGFDTVDAAYEAYTDQWSGLNGGSSGENSGSSGENGDAEEEPVFDGRVEYNGTIYDDIYVGVEAAREAGGVVKLLGSATMDKTLQIPANITIDGDGHTLSRADGFTGTMFSVETGMTLTAEELTMDGSGATATGNLIATEGSGSIVLNAGTVLQNNNGAHAVNLVTRGGGTLTLNGAEIINNSSDSGAIWGGGHIIVNEGSKINNNSSTGSAGAIRMVGQCNLTMNGGEICNNTAVADGGAIWGYGVNGNSSTYDLNGGKISGNTAGGTGGAIYTGTYSTVNMSGDFEMCNNTASDSGAMRITNYTILNMTGGKISDNTSTNNASNNGFYGWCPRLTLSGGELADNISIAGGHTPTIGGCNITGIIYFDIGTNHNTINLAVNFGSFKFTVSESENFAAFNFKPAAGYTYTTGDEAKLICLNDGYSTYWDAASGTFKLQAN